jgi:hypothetical protein
VIVRLLLWNVADAGISVDQLRERVEALEPLPAPSGWLWNESHDRFGVLLLLDEDELEVAPAQVAAVRALLDRDPELFEEFDLLR